MLQSAFLTPDFLHRVKKTLHLGLGTDLIRGRSVSLTGRVLEGLSGAEVNLLEAFLIELVAKRCPEHVRMQAFACDDRTQCFEPCGSLGNDPAHAVVSNVEIPVRSTKTGH